MRDKIEALVFSWFLGIAIISQRVASPSYDSDILWSVAIGKWIDMHRAFPVIDSFSWTINGKEWMTHEWAYSFLAYQFSEAFGSFGFYLLTLIPIVFTIYFLYLMAKYYDTNKNYAYLLSFTIGVVLIYFVSIAFRAYVYALLFVTVLLYLLYFKKEEKYDFVSFSAIFILWANFQVSVFIGLVIVIAENIRKYFLNPSTRRHSFLIVTVCILSTFINPYGYKLWSYFLFVITNMSGHRMIEEWQAANFNEAWILLIYLATAAIILILQYTYKNDQVLDQPLKNKGTFRELNRNTTSLFYAVLDWGKSFLTKENCLIIGYWCFYIYALYSVRMLMFALILWTIVFSYFVGKAKQVNFGFKTYYICLTLFATIFLVNLVDAGFSVKDTFSYQKDITPVEEVTFLKNNPAYSDHLFNDYMYGAFLILNDIPVFIDARCDSYIRFGILQKYADIKALKEDPQNVFDGLDVRNLLIGDGALKKYIDINPRWKLVYEGPTACIYTRNDT